MDPDKNLFMKLKQFKKREQQERSWKVQATKSTGRMPWHQEPTKDATNCDKPRGAVNKRNIRGSPNGATHMMKNHVT